MIKIAGDGMQILDNTFLANLNFVCRQGGQFSAPPSSAWRLSNAAFEQNKFYYLMEGGFHIRLRDKSYLARPGDWFYIPAGVNHGYSSHAELPMNKYWMHFDLYPSDILSKLPRLPMVVRVPEEQREEVETRFAAFSHAFHAADLTRRMEAKAEGIRLLALFLRLAFPEDIPILQETPEELMTLLAYIHQNLALPLTNADLAALMHLHPVYFCRWFRDRVGQAPQQYVRQCRLEAGKRLLEKTDDPVSSIAHEVGFYDAAHFSHAFCRNYSLNPSQYRTMVRIDHGFHPERMDPPSAD